jgi:hypothetical protein
VHPPWHGITPKPKPVHVGIPDGDVDVDVNVNVDVDVMPVAESPDDWLAVEDVIVEEVLLVVLVEDVDVEEVLLVVPPEDWLVLEDVDVDEVLLLVPPDDWLAVEEVLLVVPPEDWLVLEDVEDTVPLLLVLEVVSVDLDDVAFSSPHDEAVVRNESVVVMVSVIVFMLLDHASEITRCPTYRTNHCNHRASNILTRTRTRVLRSCTPSRNIRWGRSDQCRYSVRHCRRTQLSADFRTRLLLVARVCRQGG